MKKIYKYVYVISLILISFFMCEKVFQNDTYYAIKVGESISKYGVDMIDHLSWYNLSYCYPHFLFDYIVYLVYSCLGFRGLYIFNIMIFIIISILFYYINRKINGNNGIVNLVCILVPIMMGTYIVVRAQSITYILFVLEFYLLNRFNDTNKRRYGIGLIIISILICNIHVAVWPFYFILYLPYIGEYIVNKIKIFKKIFYVRDNIKISKLFILIIISLIGGLCTPLGSTPYTYFILTSMGDTEDYILEHAMLGWNDGIIIATLVGVFILVLIMVFKSKKKIYIFDIFMILGLGLMTIMSSRHFSLFIIIGMFCICRIICNYFKDSDSILKELFDMSLFKYIVIIEILFVSIVKYVSDVNKDYVDKTKYPVEASTYIIDNYDVKKIRLFNEYNYGSYLAYRDIPVFIDSRADLYSKEFNKGVYIFDDVMAIGDGDMDKFYEYDFDVAICLKDNLICSNLDYSSTYKKVYSDDYFWIFEKE